MASRPTPTVAGAGVSRCSLESDSSPVDDRPSPSRSQARIRRSACSDLQGTAIPEGRVYNGNRRRASLFVGRPSEEIVPTTTTRSSDTGEELSPSDYVQLCRERCQSLYRSLAPTSDETVKRDDSPEESDVDDDDQITFEVPPPRRNYRYSLPDASPAALALRNFLKRNKTTKARPRSDDLRLDDLPSTHSSSPRSTFRHFLSLVKLPSTKSSSSSSHHSSLTTLNNANTLDQTPGTTHQQWRFQSETSQWCSTDGINKITLASIELHNLTSAEHNLLKRLILQRLQTPPNDLGVVIHLPSDEPSVRKRKHHFMFRSKSSDKSKELKDAKSNGNIFGVALSQCVLDDDCRGQDESSVSTHRKNSVETTLVRRTSPSESLSSTNDSGCSISPVSPTSLPIGDVDYDQLKFRSVSLEALGANEGPSRISRCKTLRCYPAKVPELIQNCCDYLEKNALQTVGLFRVGVSKKRLKELKDQVNSSRNLTFDSSTNAHDIAGLIKEFLRELPEPLLTRDLSVPFLNVRTKLPSKDQSRVLTYLISLLPSSNRDTLYTLLKFLHHVSNNSQDRHAPDGTLLFAGNKMDTSNLAIVFAPTILMDGKAPAISSKDMSVAMSADQMEQGANILKMMIEQYKELFMVPKELHDEVSRMLHESDPMQLIRALAFKVQNGCGITSMQLDETTEQQFISIDFSPLLEETNNTTTSTGFVPRRYNLRRNSDFPCSSSHASRSSEFLQVPHQRATNSSSSSRIREARMDQLIFRLIDPQFSSIEPTINVTTCEETPSTSDHRRPSLPSKDDDPSPVPVTAAPPLLREIRSYARSKTAPLSSPGVGVPSSKQCEARDLCGSSSNDEKNSKTSSTFV